MNRLRSVVGALLLVLGSVAWAGPAQTVVLANRNVPGSEDLARHYMAVRAIPENHLCVLDLPAGESISRQQYNSRLRDPLLAFLRDRSLIKQAEHNPAAVLPNQTRWDTLASSLKYLVSVYGVPLRVEDTKTRVAVKVASLLGKHEMKNTAAVDSELALLLHKGYPIQGPIPNPAFNSLTWPNSPGTRFLLIAARLDGPSPEQVRRMIDDAVAAERYGLQGRAYFDARGISDPAYFPGDYWIREAYERFLREGYECVIDTIYGLWGDSYPMEDAAVYLGWYSDQVTGPLTRADFQFRPGAIAYHLYSGSAISLRTSTEYWAGPLLARGATATMGAVGEPYLAFTPFLDAFVHRLCDKRTFGESAYVSMARLSWQITVVGDPLYRPFRFSLDEQIRHLEEDGRADVEWAYVRKINLLIRDGRFNLALDYCREKMEKTGSLVLREKLGDLYARNRLMADATAAYQEVAEGAATAATAARAGAKWLRILRMQNQVQEADLVEARIRERWEGSPLLGWLETAGGRSSPPVQGADR